MTEHRTSLAEATNDATAPQFTITRIFDAPRPLVWRAWTEQADAAAWWHPRGISIKPGTVALDLPIDLPRGEVDADALRESHAVKSAAAA